ncbi:hypothetical protein GGI04_005453 [Coemansia thaxteri]|uniref:Thioesterase domain-containing protein n=1 Tax=Coemansia thaxteri TaxID=2663907 RepID=A0A9W8BP61_9FUNG|nr:hypothetical protein GGI04_005453 [Coemansia thaxteri]KAJ2008379.1 hypothetical protein H4R26_000235 [Coemansia thaxteri]KAJ2469659.1 hypothetical protein GGI02_003343 [Coemansia sp. RSA 2322]KAJ2487606.1 hypothetical protein EV174_000434 [Coemansia sp. RSA 2320]
MASALANSCPVSLDVLAQRAHAHHQTILAANVRLTTPPVSRLRLESITPTASTAQRLTSARLSFSFTIEPSDCNAWGTLHGGCVFTLCNAAGKIATAVVADGARNIVSTDLTTNYLSGVPVASTISIEIECLRTTKSIAFLRGSIRDANGALCYICSQNVSYDL